MVGPGRVAPAPKGPGPARGGPWECGAGEESRTRSTRGRFLARQAPRPPTDSHRAGLKGPARRQSTCDRQTDRQLYSAGVRPRNSASLASGERHLALSSRPHSRRRRLSDAVDRAAGAIPNLCRCRRSVDPNRANCQENLERLGRHTNPVRSVNSWLTSLRGILYSLDLVKSRC